MVFWKAKNILIPAQSFIDVCGIRVYKFLTRQQAFSSVSSETVRVPVKVVPDCVTDQEISSAEALKLGLKQLLKLGSSLQPLSPHQDQGW